jgi:hypothetical protein
MPSKLSLETATPVAILSCSEAYRTAFGEHYLKGQDRMLKGNGGKEAVTTQAPHSLRKTSYARNSSGAVPASWPK